MQSFNFAAKRADMDVLEGLRENKCSWDESTCKNAAVSGDLDVLQWLRSHGCPWDHHTCSGRPLEDVEVGEREWVCLLWKGSFFQIEGILFPLFSFHANLLTDVDNEGEERAGLHIFQGTQMVTKIPQGTVEFVLIEQRPSVNEESE